MMAIMMMMMNATILYCLHCDSTVPSENKRDQRTIEQVLADSRARKKQRTETSEPNESTDQLPQRPDDSVE